MTGRFTLDGSEALEAELRELTLKASQGVRSRIPAGKLEGLILGGGYGRGEGGVLKTDVGDRPYNDLEFFVFVRGPVWLNERRYRASLHELGAQLSEGAGLEVEFKILSLDKFQSSPVSMFYYDLVSGHKIVFGDEHLWTGCDHHRAAHRIPLYECTRLLMNRCSGLLFALDRLQRLPFSASDADFASRNIAKAQLAFGDVLLAACGQYHWSCRERHRRLPKLLDEIDAPWVERVCEEHTEGILFKLHPQRSTESPGALFKRHETISELGRTLWLWLENRRLNARFATARDYSFDNQNKCSEIPRFKARAVSLKTFGFRSVAGVEAARYPRERLLRTLPLLLWHSETAREATAVAWIQKQLRTLATDFHGWVLAYQTIWSRFN